MKLLKTFILFILLINTTLINSNENLTLFKRLYYKARSLREKQVVLSQMQKVVSDDFIDFIMEIIVDQSNYNFSILEAKDYENWCLESAKMAAQLKIEKSALYLERIYNKSQSAIVKGQILLTIAQTGNKSYIEWLNNALYKINNLHREKKYVEKEEIIQGIVIGLGLYADKSSFVDLLYAATPNYSNKTQELAKSAIDKITDNPALLCNDIILNNPNYDNKIDALLFAIESKSPDETKINTCKMTLKKTLGTDVENKLEIKKIKLLNESVKYLGKMKVQDKEIVNMIEQKWDDENDFYSAIINIQALESISSEDAAKLLNKKLSYWNKRKKEGSKDGYLSDEGPKVIVALIQALGSIKYIGSAEVLYDTIWTEGYGDNINREALKSIDLIMNNTKK